jgi:amidophosphoribosyltransferase
MKKHIKILKKKLKNFDPKLKEECGVFGVSNAKDASALTALGLTCTSTSWSRGLRNCDF